MHVMDKIGNSRLVSGQVPLSCYQFILCLHVWTGKKQRSVRSIATRSLSQLGSTWEGLRTLPGGSFTKGIDTPCSSEWLVSIPRIKNDCDKSGRTWNNDFTSKRTTAKVVLLVSYNRAKSRSTLGKRMTRQDTGEQAWPSQCHGFSCHNEWAAFKTASDLDWHG